MRSSISERLASDLVFTRRAFWLGLFFAALCLAQPALALEKYAAIPLPDERLGSQALALAQAGPGQYGVVGTQQKSDGTVGAVYWNLVVDPSNPNVVYASELPKPPGWNAMATGIAFLEGNPDRPIIIGSIYFDGSDVGLAGSNVRAVLWTRDAAGRFTNTTLDDEAASQANAIATRQTLLGLIIVVCGKYRLPNGDWHACLWELGPQGRRRIDLGTHGGRNSEATSLVYVDDLIGWNIVGNAQMAQGRTVATFWTSNASGHVQAHALPTPSGAQSRALGLSVRRDINDIYYIVGEVSEPNGRTTANIWINQGELPTALTVGNGFGDVLGRRNSTAKGIIVSGRDGDDLWAIGSAWNTESDRTGLGVLASRLNARNPLSFDFDSLRNQDIEVENDETHFSSLNAVAPSGAIAGAGLRSGSTTTQAMLLLPTDREAPRIITVLIGLLKLGPDIRDQLGNLWQADGQALSFTPHRTEQDQNIMIEFTGAGFSAASSRLPRQLRLVSRLVPLRPNATASATLTLQLYDPAFAVWVTVGHHLLASDEFFQRVVMEIPNPERFAVSDGAPLRWRIGLRGEEWRDWELDLVELEVTRN